MLVESGRVKEVENRAMKDKARECVRSVRVDRHRLPHSMRDKLTASISFGVPTLIVDEMSGDFFLGRARSK